MEGLELIDLDFNGLPFTWHGTRNGTLVEVRLDRWLSNWCWQDCWSNTSVTHDTMVGSYHCSLIIQRDPNQAKCKKHFCFETFWVKEKDCKQSKQKFKVYAGEIEELIGQLGELKNNWATNANRIQEITITVDKLLEQDECFLQQRSLVKCLRNGDANTAFFHQSTLQMRRRNNVVKLRKDDGMWKENPNGLKYLIDEYFINVFKSGGPRERGQVLECITMSVTDEMNHTLLLRITQEEIAIAARQMGDLKAPGPDDFQGIFYHSYCDCIVKEVNELVMYLSNGDTCPWQFSATHIVLIPKVPNPEFVSQFQPISLCNFSYKVLSKVLSNRLKPLLPKIISPMQNAFVGGRQIQDNIGIAHELFHFLKLRKTKSKFELGIKLDMHKAYDRVDWDFLDADDMPFYGDQQHTGVWNSHHGPPISHIFFADDTLIFLKVDRSNYQVLGRLIEDLCVASGQTVNLQKSCVFFSANIHAAISEELGNILGVSVVSDPGTYLGVLAIWGRSKSRGLAYVKDAVCNELDSMIMGFWWGQKHDAKWGSRASWAWTSLLVGRDVIMQRAKWQISDGRELISFPLGHHIPRGPVHVTLDTRVQTFLCPITRSWDLNSLLPFLFTEELDDITGSDVGIGSGFDRLI
ncbi:hypothetical protein ACFX10_005428 [Malus domestica]